MLYPILAVVNLLCCCGKYAINALAGGADGTLFKNSTGDISDKYYLEITPAGWTFSIWGVIYTLEVLWIVYSLTFMCRGANAYTDPVVLPLGLFVLYILGSGINVGWLISFDRQELVAALVILILYSLLFYAMLALTYITLDRASPRLVDSGRVKDIWLTRAFVHNGIAMQATWVSVATSLNVAMVSTYRGDLSQTDASTLALSILSAEIAVFAITDLGFLDRYSRYTITPYIVLVVALSGSLAKNYVEGARNSVFTVVMLAFAVALLLAKLVVTAVRHSKGRAITTSYDATIGGSSKGNLA